MPEWINESNNNLPTTDDDVWHDELFLFLVAKIWLNPVCEWCSLLEKIEKKKKPLLSLIPQLFFEILEN